MRADVRDSPEPAPAKAGERLPKELAAQGIDTMQSANRYLAEHYRAAFNEEFAVPAAESGTAFVPFIGPGLVDVVCEHHERTVNRDNCVSFEGKRLQIPAQTHRCHFIKAPRCIVTLTDAWQCSTGLASSPSTSPMAPSSQNARPRRCAPASEPGALAERLCACGHAPARPYPEPSTWDSSTSASWGAGAWAWRTRAALTRSRCRPAPRRACAPRGCGWRGLATPMDDSVREVPSRESVSVHVRGRSATGRRGTVSPLTPPPKRTTHVLQNRTVLFVANSPRPMGAGKDVPPWGRQSCPTRDEPEGRV